MSEIAKLVGARLRAYRQQKKLSQEAVAERAGLHPTYIGQLERGEKNASLETVEKVCGALELPMTKLFENLPEPEGDTAYAAKCYNVILTRPLSEQKMLFELIKKILAYHDT